MSFKDVLIDITKFNIAFALAGVTLITTYNGLYATYGFLEESLPYCREKGAEVAKKLTQRPG